MAEDQEVDLLEMLGMDSEPVPLTPEENLFFRITRGVTSEESKRLTSQLDNMLYWLKHRIAEYEYILERNLVVTTTTYGDNKVIQQIKVSNTNYVRIMIEYYLLLFNGSWFTKDIVGGKADLTKVVDMFMKHPLVVKLIKDSHDNGQSRTTIYPTIDGFKHKIDGTI